MKKIRAFLRPEISPMLRGSPARGSDQWWTAEIGGLLLEAKISGSGAYLELEGTSDNPILPPVDMGNFRCFVVPCDAPKLSPFERHFVYKSAYASSDGTASYEIVCEVLQDGLNLARQIKDETAKETKLPMKQAVAVATRKRRRIHVSPNLLRRRDRCYDCRHLFGGGRHYTRRHNALTAGGTSDV